MSPRPIKFEAPKQSSYQQNLSQPVDTDKWYSGTIPTSYEIMGRIGQIAQTDKTAAANFLRQYQQFQSAPGTPYYNPYTQATNKSIANLAQLGVDTSNINDDWLNQYKFLEQYYTYNGVTNTPSTPGSKATVQQKAAYEYYQIAKAHKDTTAVNREWEALRQELNYWAQRRDRNFSDDQIIENINWSKYPTLKRLNESLEAGGTILELNNGTSYSKDAMRGVIWAGRNNGGTGMSEIDTVYSAMGVGNQWQDDPELRELLNPTSDKYNPYLVGSTLEEEGLYFGRFMFDQNWVNENKNLMNSSDATERKMYQSVAKAETYTQTLEQELAAMDKSIKDMLATTQNPEDIISMIEGDSAYRHLFELDDSMKPGGELKSTTRAVNYKWESKKDEIRWLCQQAKNNPTPQMITADTVDFLTGENTKQSEVDFSIEKQWWNNTSNAGLIVFKHGTEAEKGALSFPTIEASVDSITNTMVNKAGMLIRTGRDLMDRTATEYAGNARTINAYNQYKEAADAAQAERDAYANELKTLQAQYKMSSQYDAYDLNLMKALRDGQEITGVSVNDVTWVRDQLTANPDDPQALAGLYYIMTGENAFNTADPEAAIDKASKMWQDSQTIDFDHVPYLSANEIQHMHDLEETDEILQGQIAEAQEYMSKHQQEYTDATEAQTRLKEQWKSGADMYKLSGMVIDDTMLEAIDYMMGVGQKRESTEYQPYSTYDSAMASGKYQRSEVSATARQDAITASNEVKALETVLSYLDSIPGLEITEDERSNIQRRIDKMRRDGRQAAYFMLDDMPDFKSTVAQMKKDIKEGSFKDKTAEWVMTGKGYQDFGDVFKDFLFRGRTRMEKDSYYEALEDADKDRYYYLLATEGVEAANAYINDLIDPDYGILTTRKSQKLAKDTQEWASQNALTSIAATGASLITKVISGPEGLIYQLGQQALGKEVNPYASAYNYGTVTQSLREGSKDSLHKLMPNVSQEAIDFLYDAIISGAADSAVNAVLVHGAFGALSEVLPHSALIDKVFQLASDGKLGKGTQLLVKAGSDFAHAVPMGLNAATEAYREAVMNGATPEQAQQMFNVTFWAETATEAITVENMSSMFSRGAAEGTKSLKAFVKELLKDQIGEAFGEGINEYWESNAERIIMGEYSEYGKNVQAYKDQGYPLSVAQKLAEQDMWKGVLKSAASGFISSGVSSTVAYAKGGGFSDNSTPDNPLVLRTQEWKPNQGQQLARPLAQTYVTNRSSAPEQLTKDLAVLFNSAKVDPQTNTADVRKANAAVASVLASSGANKTNAIAAGVRFVKLFAHNDNHIASQTVSQMLKVEATMGVTGSTVKDDIIWASLASGNAAGVLSTITQKVADHQAVTPYDLEMLRSAVQDDKTGDLKQQNLRAFYANAKDQIIAIRTAQKIAQGGLQGTETQKKAVRQAKDNLKRAQENQKNVQAEADVAAETLRNAEANYDPTPGHEDTAAPLEQAANRVAGLQTQKVLAEQGVQTAEQQVQKAETDLDNAGQEALTQLRQEAAAEVEQEAQQEREREEANRQEIEAAGQYNPENRVTMFDRPFEVKLAGQDGTVKLAGVLAHSNVANSTESETIFMTTDGRYVSSRALEDVQGDRETFAAFDSAVWDTEPNTGFQPKVWLPQSLRATTADGTAVEVVGIEGQIDGRPVVVDQNGNVYEAVDLAFENGEADEANLDQMFEEAHGTELPEWDLSRPNNIRVDTSAETVDNESNVSENDAEEATGGEVNVETADNGGELAVESGQPDGSGSNGVAGQDTGEAEAGRAQTRPAEYNRPDASRTDARLLKSRLRNILKAKSVSKLDVKKNTNKRRFSDALEAAKQSSPYGLFVDSQSPQELKEKGAIMLMTPNGTAGVAIGTKGEYEGNIFGVFKSPHSRASNWGVNAIAYAVAQGGNKLDCYDGRLRIIYEMSGMIPVARVPFNDEYAPEGWNYERDGRPDVIMWMYCGDSVEDMVKKYGLPEENGGYHSYTDEEIANLPASNDYDEAWKFRDDMLKEQMERRQAEIEEWDRQEAERREAERAAREAQREAERAAQPETFEAEPVEYEHTWHTPRSGEVPTTETERQWSGSMLEQANRKRTPGPATIAEEQAQHPTRGMVTTPVWNPTATGNGAVYTGTPRPVTPQAVKTEQKQAPETKPVTPQTVSTEQKQTPETQPVTEKPVTVQPKAAPAAQSVTENRVRTEQRQTVNPQPITTAPVTTETPTEAQAKKVKLKYSPQRIAKTLVKALGIGDYIGTSKFGSYSPDVRSWYDAWSNSIGIRNADAGDFVKALHEAGKALERMYGLSKMNPDALQTMIKNMPSELKEGVGAEEMPGEAIAEFLRLWMTDEQGARDFAGTEFYDAFERTVRGADLNNVNSLNDLRNYTEQRKRWNALSEARDQLRAWLEADAGEKMGSVIRNRNERSHISLRDFFRQSLAGIVDSTTGAINFDRAVREMAGDEDVGVLDSVRAQALRANTAGKQAVSILTGAGLTDAQGRRIGASYADAIAATGFTAQNGNMDRLVQYMLAMHSLDRDAQGKPVFDNHITTEDRIAFIKNMEKNHPEVAKAAEAHWNFHRQFMYEFLVKTGRLSEEAFNQMNEIYPHYVPTMRVKHTDGVAQKTGKAKTFKIRRATGSTEDIYNPIDSWFGMVNTIVTQNALNRAVLAFDRMYQKYDGLGAFAHEVKTGRTGDNVVDLTTKQQQVQELVGNMVDADTLSQLMAIVGRQGFDQHNPSTSYDVLQVVRPDGTTAEYQFEDMELFKLLAGLNEKSSNAALDAIGFLTRGMSALTTGNNPIFSIRNFMRDFQNSVNYGSWAASYGDGLFKWLSAAYDVWRTGSPIAQKLGLGESELYKDYQALGGGGWTRIDPSRTATRNELYSGAFKGYNKSNSGLTAKYYGKKLWNAITLSRLNEVVEQASRFAEFKYGKHATTAEGRAEAYLASQEASVDFSRSGNGSVAVMAKKLVPFFNASLQGVYRTSRMLTEEERSRAPQRFTKTVVNTLLLSALCNGLLLKFMGDDEKKEYEMLSDDLKSKHFYLPNFAPDVLGEAPLIRIPLAQDPLTYAIHGMMSNAMWSGTSDGLVVDIAAIADTILDNLNPIGSGTIMAPILAINSNKSWYGSPIVPSYLQRNKYAPDQYTEETPEVFRDLGRALNMSPMKVQYLAEQYTGFIGQLAIPALSKDATGEIGGLHGMINAVRKKFTSDPLISSDVTSSFYDAADLLNSVVEETNQGKPLNVLRPGLTRDEAVAAYKEAKALTSTVVNDTKEEINNRYDQIDEINANATLSDHDKYEKTSALRREIIELVLDANEKLGPYVEKYARGTNLGIRAIQGAESYKPTVEDELPQTFKDDIEQPYMQYAYSTYNALSNMSKAELKAATGVNTTLSTLLPHPSQKITVNGVEHEIPDEQWDTYLDKYKIAYAYSLSKLDKPWDQMSYKEQVKALQAAGSAGNAAMRKYYEEAGSAEPFRDTTGRYGRGNIDLNNRPVVENEDGTISTELSITIGVDDKVILIPTVVNGKIVSDEEAIRHYERTGEYLGKFDTEREAGEYAEKLHNRQDWYYNR